MCVQGFCSPGADWHTRTNAASFDSDGARDGEKGRRCSGGGADGLLPRWHGPAGFCLICRCKRDLGGPGEAALSLLWRHKLRVPSSSPEPSLEELGSCVSPELATRREEQRREKKRRRQTICLHFTSACDPCSFLCAPLPHTPTHPTPSTHTHTLSASTPLGEKGCLWFPSILQPPTLTPPPSHCIDSPALNWPFQSGGGADGGDAHCWITALSRRSTPPRRQQKRQTPLFGSGGKQLGTDDANRPDLCSDKVFLWWGRREKPYK